MMKVEGKKLNRWLLLALLGFLAADFLLKHLVFNKEKREELRYWLEYHANRLGIEIQKDNW